MQCDHFKESSDPFFSPRGLSEGIKSYHVPYIYIKMQRVSESNSAHSPATGLLMPDEGYQPTPRLIITATGKQCRGADKSQPGILPEGSPVTVMVTFCMLLVCDVVETEMVCAFARTAAARRAVTTAGTKPPLILALVPSI